MAGDRVQEHAAMMLEIEAAELELEAEAEAALGMRIADPDEEASTAEADAPVAEASPVFDDATLEDLRDREDVDALLRRAKAYRTGDGVERDLEKCFEHYRAAAELGDSHGQYSLALFYLSGAVVAEDASVGLGKLRSAAQAGSLRAKVYLANAYELGVGRDPDEEKADVWYRSAARSAKIEIDPEADEQAFTLAMAELGSIRHARSVLRDASIPKKERYEYLRKAKALGYALHQRNKQRASMEQEEIAREVEEAMKPPPEEASEEASKTETAAKAETQTEEEAKPRIGPSNPHLGERFMAFVIALVIVGFGIGAGAFGTAAARQLLAEGKSVPVVGVHYGYILPAAVAAAMVPVGLVYQWRTIILSTVAALVLGGAGWTLWKNPAGSLFVERLMQAHVFGLVGLVVALFAIGLLGGTRRRRWSK